MGHRLSKIVTKTGDAGSTGLADGSRVDKDDARVHLYGEIDELNSVIGTVYSVSQVSDSLQAMLQTVQHHLFDLGSEYCLPGHSVITEQQITQLEAWIAELNADLPALKEFILPGGSAAGALCHVARTVCRRVERSAVTLHKCQPHNADALRYLNRLSDLLFIMARVLTRKAGCDEILWNHQRQK